MNNVQIVSMRILMINTKIVGSKTEGEESKKSVYMNSQWYFVIRFGKKGTSSTYMHLEDPVVLFI
jgi:hypothetical protein